jgi:hypothetical protein
VIWRCPERVSDKHTSAYPFFPVSTCSHDERNQEPAPAQDKLVFRVGLVSHVDMKSACGLMTGLWFAGFACLQGGATPPPDWPRLVESGKRHGMPFPDAFAKLALVHSESWTVVGNKSHPHDPAIYVPGWVLEERKDGSLRALIGLHERVLEPRERREPLWRGFSIEEIPARIGGHVAEFDGVSTFAVAVQCAARGDRRRADLLWERFAKEGDISDGFGAMRYDEDMAQPGLLLAAMLFDLQELKIADPGADLASGLAGMVALMQEFPKLGDQRRKDLVARLKETVNAKPPKADSIEALLIAWGRSVPGGAEREEKEKEEIIRRGFEAIPELLRLRHDRRLTAQRYPAIMMRPSSPKSLGDLARDILAELLPDAEGLRTGFDSPVDGHFDKSWQRAEKEGERNYYLRQAWKRDREGKIGFQEGALTVLAAKAPDELAGLVARYDKEAKDGSGCWDLVHAIAASALPPAGKTGLLLKLAGKGDIGRRRAAIQVLAGIDQEAAKEPARVLLRMLPKDAPGAYWTSDIAGVSHVVLAVDDNDVWKTFLTKTRKAAVGLRLEWMNPFDYLYVGDRLKDRRLAFLSAFLDDETLRDDSRNAAKYEGPCAAFTFPKITVRDFAAMQIASILKIDPLDPPDATWTKEQWAGLRLKVKGRLKAEGVTPMQ